tara:strand:- start:1200 stop:1388 length:189 start_codon:yes stop_codon:yes gene_type:complete
MGNNKLTNKEIVEKLLKRQDFLLCELAAAGRLDGWNLRGVTQELKVIRDKITTLENGGDLTK